MPHDKDGCKGCLNYNIDNINCDLFEAPGICPCSICLIKGMCRNACVQYENYYEHNTGGGSIS